MTVIISIVYYTVLCKAGFLHNNAIHSSLKLRKSKSVNGDNGIFFSYFEALCTMLYMISKGWWKSQHLGG